MIWTSDCQVALAKRALIDADVLPGMTPEQTGIVGTSFYISPEINEGWPQHDEKVKEKHRSCASAPDPNAYLFSTDGCMPGISLLMLSL